MATLKELAAEYRRSAAKLAMWLEDKKAAGELTPAEERSVREALTEIREVQRLLDGYYDVPRPEGLCAVGWKAGVRNDD